MINHLREKYPTIIEVSVPATIGTKSLDTVETSNSSKAAPITAGIESRKENLVICLFVTPLNNPVPMVAPLLEIPGIIARPWAVPINKESSQLSFL